MKKTKQTLPAGITKLPPGVEIRGKAIRIYFPYKGSFCREPLKGLTITKANIKYAGEFRAGIMHKIATRTFDYASEFPESTRAKQFPTAAIHNIGEALDQWLALKEVSCAPSTLRGYRKDIEIHLKPRWGHYTFQAIRKTELESWLIKDLIHLSSKTVKNLLAPLRAVIKDACLDGVIQKNPFDFIKTPRSVKTKSFPI